MQTEFFFNLYNAHRPCVHKILHLAFTKASRADMQTQNLHENNSRTQICSPHLRCAPEKGPGQYRTTTQNGFMISMERQNREATNTTKKLFLCYFSSPLPLFFLLSQSFVLPRQGILSGWFQQLKRWGRGEVGKERVRKGAKAAVAIFEARHNFITTSWAMKNMTSSPFDVTAVEGEG